MESLLFIYYIVIGLADNVSIMKSYHQEDEMMPQNVWVVTGWPQKKYKKGVIYLKL